MSWRRSSSFLLNVIAARERPPILLKNATLLVRNFPRLSSIETATPAANNPLTTPLTAPSNVPPAVSGVQSTSNVAGTFQLDTHAAVMLLKKSGFTEAQAELITKLFVQLSAWSVDSQNRQLVTKAQQEIVVQQMLAQMSSIKKDMVILERSEFANLRHETEKQAMAIKQLESKMQDELAKLKGGFTLDLNLEKSRNNDERAATQLTTNKLQHKMETDIAQVTSKIETQVAQMAAVFERHKTDIVKYFIGMVASCLTICIGFYRMTR